jgi:hypothetical protein
VVRNLRASENTLTGLSVEGWGSALRNNIVIGTGGTLALGSNPEVSGIVAMGFGLRVLGNDVIQTTGGGTGNAIGLELRAADGSFADRNRISNTAISPGAIGIRVGSGDDVTVTGSRLGQLEFGIVFGAASGKYRGNLASDVTTPYTGGSNAGNNQ